MKQLLLILLIVVLYLLHQDFWFWNSATPLVFGFLPIGLFYHLVYTLVISGVMWLNFPIDLNFLYERTPD